MNLITTHYKKIIGLTWLVFLCVVAVYVFQYVGSHDMTFKEFLFMVQGNMEKFLLSNMLLAPIIYIVIYIIRPLVLFPTSILTPLSAVVFGPFFGWIYTYIGENIAASVAFLVARYFGGDQVSRFKKLKLIDDELKDHGLRTVIFLRLVPLFPFDVVNFGLGLTSVKFKQYVIGTAIGVIPGLTAYIFLGASLFSGMYIIPTIICFIILSLFAEFLRKRNKNIMKKLL